jgi:hypothetical protein
VRAFLGVDIEPDDRAARIDLKALQAEAPGKSIGSRPHVRT